MSQDVLTALDTIRSQIRKQLLQNAEYRAMLSIERTIAEIYEIMGSNAERRNERMDHRYEREDPRGHEGHDQTPQAINSVLESIAAKAVNTVASRNAMQPFSSGQRSTQAGR
jgi:hypothetical protein